MRLSIKSKEQRQAEQTKWHKKFAWLPQRLNGDTMIWLESYMRRIEYGSWERKTLSQYALDELSEKEEPKFGDDYQLGSATEASLVGVPLKPMTTQQAMDQAALQLAQQYHLSADSIREMIDGHDQRLQGTQGNEGLRRTGEKAKAIQASTCGAGPCQAEASTQG